MEQEIFAAIMAAGNNPDALRQVAIRYGLDPSFVASVAAGTGRTTMAQAFDPSLLVAAGIISPDVLSAGLTGAGETALKEAMQEWDKAFADLIPEAPQFASFVESKYSGIPVAANAFAAIRAGTPLELVRTSPAVQGLKNQFKAPEWNELMSDLESFNKDWSKFEQDMFEFESSSGGLGYQAAVMALGERPTAETFDTSQARLDYAKALGMPALALLPDPNQTAGVTAQEVKDAFGGSEMHQSMIDYVNSFRKRADARKDLPVAQNIRGYGAIGREPEGVAPLSSIPLRLRGGSGMDVYERLASIPQEDRIQGLQGAAATAGRAPQTPTKPKGLSQQEIRDLDLQIAAEKEAELAANLAFRRKWLAESKPNPFQQALQQFNIFGALEANV